MLADVMTVLRPRSATNRDGCGQRTRTLRMERDLLKKVTMPRWRHDRGMEMCEGRCTIATPCG